MLGDRRAVEVYYAKRLVGGADCEDITHDAYVLALERAGRPTRVALLIRQCAWQFLRARRRGWTVLGSVVEAVASGEVSIGERVDTRRALERCEPADVGALVALEGDALSRAVARRARFARRRVRLCLTETC